MDAHNQLAEEFSLLNIPLALSRVKRVNFLLHKATEYSKISSNSESPPSGIPWQQTIEGQVLLRRIKDVAKGIHTCASYLYSTIGRLHTEYLCFHKAVSKLH